jgi:hypothetical protein
MGPQTFKENHSQSKLTNATMLKFYMLGTDRFLQKQWRKENIPYDLLPLKF